MNIIILIYFSVSLINWWFRTITAAWRTWKGTNACIVKCFLTWVSDAGVASISVFFHTFAKATGLWFRYAYFSTEFKDLLLASAITTFVSSFGLALSIGNSICINVVIWYIFKSSFTKSLSRTLNRLNLPLVVVTVTYSTGIVYIYQFIESAIFNCWIEVTNICIKACAILIIEAATATYTSIEGFIISTATKTIPTTIASTTHLLFLIYGILGYIILIFLVIIVHIPIAFAWILICFFIILVLSHFFHNW